jgi:DNA polymerase-3 subunit delta'
VTAVLPGLEHHPHARAVLGPALPPEGRASHAYLFHGPAGTGKRAVARAFAAALLADGAADAEGAAQRVLRDSHPDLTWVTPSGAAEMLVSDIDEPVVAAAARTPFESARRVFVIERAETMNDATANRMLKTLEEPPAFVHLILLSDRPGELLETITSRCQAVRFDPLPADEIAAQLEREGVAPEHAQACARLALGDGARARALALGEGPTLRAIAERCARSCLAGARSGDTPGGTSGEASGGTSGEPWTALLALAKADQGRAAEALDTQHAEAADLVARSDRKRFEREHSERVKRAERRARMATLDLGLALIGLWFRDIACVLDNAPEIVHATDRSRELREDAAGRDAHTMRAALELVEDTRQRLAVNVSEDLAFEALGYRLAALLSTDR